MPDEITGGIRVHRYEVQFESSAFFTEDEMTELLTKLFENEMRIFKVVECGFAPLSC